MVEVVGEEVRALIKVTAWVAPSMAYARLASSAVAPGKRRLLALLPALLPLPFLPFLFSSLHLRAISAFFLAWLAAFKLLLLSSALGPLHPSLPLLPFLAAASLPVHFTPPKTQSSTAATGLLPSSAASTAVKVVLLSLITPLYRHRRRIAAVHPYLLLSLYCCHMYLALELVLAAAAASSAALLGLRPDPQFDAPYLSTSLQDFWGRRWNLMVSAVLRPSVYLPVRRRFGTAAGVVAAFLVSGLMHELMFFYLTSAGPTGEVTCFFALHGVCVAAEVWAKRKARERGWRRLHPVVAVPVAVGFVTVTGFWLFFPPILRSGAEERVLEESVAMMTFLQRGGRDLARQVGLLWERAKPTGR